MDSWYGDGPTIQQWLQKHSPESSLSPPQFVQPKMQGKSAKWQGHSADLVITDEMMEWQKGLGFLADLPEGTIEVSLETAYSFEQDLTTIKVQKADGTWETLKGVTGFYLK
jgi:hypothetical protein